MLYTEPTLVVSYADYLSEAQEPKSEAHRQAISMGLEYYGFGRYGKDNQVQYLSHNGKLIPFHSPVPVTKNKNWQGKTEVKVDQSQPRPSEGLKSVEEVSWVDLKLKQYNKQMYPKFKDEQLDAIEELLGDKTTKQVNKSLMQGKNVNNPDHVTHMQTLDSVFDIMECPIAFTTYRPTQQTAYKKNKVYSFSGYVKTNIDPRNFIKNSDGHLLSIEINKGISFVYDDAGSKNFYLPKGTHIRIISDAVAVDPPIEDKKGKPTTPVLLFKAILEDSDIINTNSKEKS
jgi:hypothetical protein